MRVLEILGEPISNGGQESFVINIISHMNLSDLQIDLLTPYYCDNDYYKSIVESCGGKIYALGLNFTPGKSRSNIKSPLTRFLKENGYDIVHIHSGSISILTFTSQIAKECGVKKVIVHSHCGIEKITLKNIVLRLLASFKMKKNVDIYCACSKIAGKAKFVKSVVDNKLVILRNGIDLERYKYNQEVRNRIRDELSISETAYVIGHVGRFSYQKNHEYLVEIFNSLLKIKPNSMLLLIGSGENENSVNEQVAKLGLTDKVIFAGNVNNVNEYMQAMDVFVLPSRFEGLPIVGVEAQGSGLPVITSTNVSRELALSDNVIFVSLDVGPANWSELIAKALKQKRKDCTESLESHGYNIISTANDVRELYLNTSLDKPFK